MSDDAGCVWWLFLVGFIVLGVGVTSCEGGRESGHREAKCATHAEYAKSGKDTLALVQKYPECAPLYFPEKL